MQPIANLIETYRFADVVSLWARERLEHDLIVARDLARAVVCDGLRIQSVDGRWVNRPDKPIEFRGYPYVGYAARPDSPMSILRASALGHLFAVVERGKEPDLNKLRDEFIDRDDFREWLFRKNLLQPKFWFEGVTAASRTQPITV